MRNLASPLTFLVLPRLFYRKCGKILKEINRHPLCKFPCLLSSSFWTRLNGFFLIFFPPIIAVNMRNTTDSLIITKQLDFFLEIAVKISLSPYHTLSHHSSLFLAKNSSAELFLQYEDTVCKFKTGKKVQEKT